jgi:hypothetical protein
MQHSRFDKPPQPAPPRPPDPGPDRLEKPDRRHEEADVLPPADERDATEHRPGRGRR